MHARRTSGITYSHIIAICRTFSCPSRRIAEDVHFCKLCKVTVQGLVGVREFQDVQDVVGAFGACELQENLRGTSDSVPAYAANVESAEACSVQHFRIVGAD